MVHSLSVRIANYLVNEIEHDKPKLSIVSYGVEILIGGLIKIAVFVTVPLLFGFFPEFAIAFLSSAFLRIPSGGAHFSAYYRCLIITLSVFSGIALIAKYTYINFYVVKVFFISSLALAFFTFIKIAPVDVKEKPIRSPLRRKRLKIISCLMIIFYFAIFIYYKQSVNNVLASGLAVLFHTLTLTEYGKNLCLKLDKLF